MSNNAKDPAEIHKAAASDATKCSIVVVAVEVRENAKDKRTQLEIWNLKAGEKVKDI
jgi:hypothetical protein